MTTRPFDIGEREKLFHVIDMLDAMVVELLVSSRRGQHYTDRLNKIRAIVPFKTIIDISPTKKPIQIGMDIDAVHIG